MPPATDSPRVTVLDVLVFVDELVLLAVLAISGAGIDAPLVARVALAGALVVVAALVWGRCLAPRAPHPIAYPQRVGAKLALFALAAIAFAATGHVAWAVVFVTISTVLVIASERQRHRLGG
jgi:hypothetical protein